MKGNPLSTIDDVLQLLESHGDSQYGGEPVTQLEHALQVAYLAEQAASSPELIAAGLLHDVGHLLHDLPDDAPDQGIDDRHEVSAYNFLRKLFPEAVCQPIGLHVAAKRYLCAVDPEYRQQLSEPSIVSLRLQGGPMSDDEVQEFDKHPFLEDAIRLRRWDDEAKIPELVTPTLEHFAHYVRRAAIEGSAS